MADLSINAAAVIAAATAIKDTGTAGETITAGQALYQSSSDARYYKADCDLSSAASTVIGIALHAASAGQPIQFITSGTIAIGASLTANRMYVLSATAGGIMPYSDALASQYVSRIGFSVNTSAMRLMISNSGITRQNTYGQESGIS